MNPEIVIQMSLIDLGIILLTNEILRTLKSIAIHGKNIKSEYNNNKFKRHAPTWDNEFDLHDGSYSISDIQDYFEFIIKKH